MQRNSKPSEKPANITGILGNILKNITKFNVVIRLMDFRDISSVKDKKKNNNQKPKEMKNTETILRKFAQISKNIDGVSYSVEYYIGNTIYHEHFKTLMDAKRFCARNSMNFKVNL